MLGNASECWCHFFHVSRITLYLWWPLENFHEVWNQKVIWNDKLYACLDYNWNILLKQGNMFCIPCELVFMQHTNATYVEQPSETCVACTLQQHYETSETELWNKHFKCSDFYVLVHVRPTLLCNLCMVGMFGLYNNLNTLRTLNGIMFMLIIFPKCASKWWLTMYGP
jgi:hypothetical protein